MRLYIKKFTTLLTGVVLAQIISFLLIPVLSRVYTPEQFGELSLFVSITGILALISTLKLNEAIMLSKTDNEIYKIIGALVYFSFFFSSCLFLLTLPILLFFEKNISYFELSSILIILLPINILGLALYNTNAIYLTKRSLYKSVSYANINRSLSLNIGQLSLSFLPKTNGLLLGNTLGNIFGSYQLFKNRENYKRYVNKNNFKKIFFKYNHFPKYNLPQSLLSNTSSALPNLLLIIPFGAENVGLFYMVLKLLNLPTTLISNTITSLFYQEASDRFNKQKKISKYYFKTLLMLVCLIIIPTFLIIYFGPIVIPRVLGETWMNTAEIIPWVALWSAGMFIYTPATKIVIIQSWQNYMVYYTLFVFLIKLGILVYGIYYLDFLETIILFCVFNFLSNLILSIVTAILLYKKEQL